MAWFAFQPASQMFNAGTSYRVTVRATGVLPVRCAVYALVISGVGVDVVLRRRADRLRCVAALHEHAA
jgi:hypothetical protein